MFPCWEIPHSWDCWEFTCSNSEPVIYTGPDVQSSSAGSQTDVSPATWAARGAARCSGCTKITHQNQTQCEDQESKNRWFFSIFTSSGPFIKFKISATTESFLFSLSIFFFNSQLLSSFNLIKKKNLLTQFGPPAHVKPISAVHKSLLPRFKQAEVHLRISEGRLGTDMCTRRCVRTTVHWQVKRREGEAVPHIQLSSTQGHTQVSCSLSNIRAKRMKIISV